MSGCDATNHKSSPGVVFSLPAEDEEMTEENPSSLQQPAKEDAAPKPAAGGSDTETANTTSSVESANTNQKPPPPHEWGPLFEYRWPLGAAGTSCMLQEQLSDLLGVKSFQRRHPELAGRRTVEAGERRHLLQRRLITEELADLGLTAVPTAVALELVQREYPDRLQTVTEQLLQRKQKLQQQQQAQAAGDAASRQRAHQRAIKSAAAFNRKFLAARPAGAVCTQTLQLLLPRMLDESSGHRQQQQQSTAYPVAILPGQFSEWCQHADSVASGPDRLNYMPLSRCLFGLPRRPPLPPVRLDNSVRCTLCERDCPAWLALECSECRARGHAACLQLPDNMLAAARGYAWQCMECKRCQECLDPGHEEQMMFCDACDRGYHTFCVGLADLPQGHWECPVCVGPMPTIPAEPVVPPSKSSRGTKRRASTAFELAAKG